MHIYFIKLCRHMQIPTYTPNRAKYSSNRDSCMTMRCAQILFLSNETNSRWLVFILVDIIGEFGELQWIKHSWLLRDLKTSSLFKILRYWISELYLFLYQIFLLFIVDEGLTSHTWISTIFKLNVNLPHH